MTSGEHPGTITIVDLSRNTRRDISASEFPEEQRFVYLRDGVPVQDRSQATERVPVVLVQRVAVDANGKAVAAPDKATTVRIVEYGPEGRALRHTTMVAAQPTTGR